MTTIDDRLGRIAYETVRPDLSGLSDGDRKALECCVQAARVCSELYLHQISPGNLGLYFNLKLNTGQAATKLLKYFETVGVPWDTFADDEPFIPGTGPRLKPKFGSMYPQDMTLREWNEYLAAYPKQRKALEDPCTIVARAGENLVTRPYSREYSHWLSAMQLLLERASEHLAPGALRIFLRLRAEDLMREDLTDSELAWVDTDGTPFELTLGPYETYADGLVGLKAMYEAFVALPNIVMTPLVQEFIPLAQVLNERFSHSLMYARSGGVSRVQVVNDVFRGGEASHGFQFMAYCLPNDRNIHRMKGSKRVISSTMLGFKYEHITLPIAQAVLHPDILPDLTRHSRLLGVTAHELAHGIGPTIVKRPDGTHVPFEAALGKWHHPLEEAKADTLGINLLWDACSDYLIDNATLYGVLVGEVVDYVRQWRVDLGEAHASGALVQFNWLKSHKCISLVNGRLTVDWKAISWLSSLGQEFLKIEASGDASRAEEFMTTWGKVPDEAHELIARLPADIPVDVHPIYDLPF